MFETQCECGKVLKVKDELAGKRAKCSGCGGVVLLVPAAAPSTKTMPPPSAPPPLPPGSNTNLKASEGAKRPPESGVRRRAGARPAGAKRQRSKTTEEAPIECDGFTYQPLRGHALAAMILIGIGAVLYLWVAIGYMDMRAQVKRSGVEQGFARSSDSNSTRNLLLLLSGIPMILAAMMWVHRASRNARALGAKGMKFTPGWSVGWFFVPIANFIMPITVLREIWRGSEGPKANVAATPPLVAAAWGLYVISQIVAMMVSGPINRVRAHDLAGQLGMIDRRPLPSANELAGALAMKSVTEVTSVIAYGLAIALIWKITNIQRSRNARLVATPEW